MNTVDLASLPAGFASPGPASQAVFRCALEALSRPGRRQALPAAAFGPLSPPAPASLAMAALLLTLLDGETTLWLSPAFDRPLLRAWLGFHTGVALRHDPTQARFAVARADELDAALWSTLARGSDELPQDGATLLVDVPSLEGGFPLQLRGPGIAGTQALCVAGVASEFWRQRQADEAQFPLGVDLLLCSGETLAGLPRSTRLTIGG